MKPFCVHYSDKREAHALLPKDAIILREQYGWMIVRIPNMNWDQARRHFGDTALVAICEQKEYWTDDEKKAEQPEEGKVDRNLTADAGCKGRSCGV
jgi:hypothetical protein